MKRLLYLLGLFLMVVLIGCAGARDADGNNNEKENNRNDNNNANEIEYVDDSILDEETTVTFMMWDDWGQGFEENIREKVEDAYPNITIENIGGDTGNKDWIEDALTADIIPDIIFAHRQYHVALLEEYRLGYDMTDLLEKHQFDLSRYEEEHLEEWKSWTQGEIWLLPFMADRYALHYNKDIFDAFGVDYPTDGMTWYEVIELAEQVTGEHNGIQYQGFDVAGGGHLAMTQIIGRNQLIDPETEEVLWVDDPYVKEYLEMLERIALIPGNEMPEEGNPWVDTMTVAMRTLWLEMHTPDELNFDIVTFPEWDDAPGIGPMYGGWAFGITEPSENKDAAMAVLKFLYEDENIIGLGEAPIHAPFNHLFLGDVDYDQYLQAERLQKFQGKNLDALYKMKPAGGPEYRSEFDVGAFTQIEHLNGEFYESDLDVNSFLRELKEKEEIRILEEKGMN